MTPAEFIAKWHARFADNSTGEISEEDLREFVSDQASFFVSGSSPQMPAGVSWIKPPTISIAGNSLSATAAEVLAGEEEIQIAPDALPINFAGPGLKRKDIFGAYYDAETPYFAILPGNEVALNAIAFSQPIPAGFIPASYLDVTDGAISQNASGAVKLIKLPNGDVLSPDINGLLTLMITDRFKGKWVEGIIEADTYWLTSAGIWRAKQKHGSATAPVTDNADWELVFAGAIQDKLWEPSTTYTVGQKRIRFGNTYECVSAHTSSTDFIADFNSSIISGTPKWRLVSEAVRWKIQNIISSLHSLDLAEANHFRINVNASSNLTHTNALIGHSYQIELSKTIGNAAGVGFLADKWLQPNGVIPTTSMFNSANAFDICVAKAVADQSGVVRLVVNILPNLLPV